LGAKATVGGLEPKALKKLKGDRFRTPSALMVLASAMGRGATPPQSRALVSMGPRSPGRMVRKATVRT